MTVHRTTEALQRVSVLDQALWKRFGDARDVDQLVNAWLGLQCRQIEEATHGVVVLGSPDDGGYSPAAFWPENDVAADGLASAAELAILEKRGIAKGLEAGGNFIRGPHPCFVAYPFLVDDKAYGSVAVRVEAETRSQLRSILRQLQWGSGKIEAVIRREEAREKDGAIDRSSAVLDTLALALDHGDFQTASSAAVTELAARLNCDQVSIGLRKGDRIALQAISNVSDFSRRMNLVRDIGRAMDEAVDQQAIIVFPRIMNDEYRIDREHQAVARLHGMASLLTVPLHAHGEFVGAVTFQRETASGFDDDEIEMADCVTSALGPVLHEKWRNNRWIFAKVGESLATQARRLLGPGYFGRKVSLVVSAIVILLLATVTGPYRITAEANVEGSVQRAIVAPFDGYIYEARAKSGEVVSEGDVLARLDDRDYVVERYKWDREQNSKSTEYDRALAAHERSQAAVLLSEIERARAEIALLDAQIERMVLRAPFDGIVISGDLSQHIGAAVRRGDELFRVAPLNSYRVMLEVDERDIADIKVGQQGKLVITSRPDDEFPYLIERITPVSESAEGQTFFRVEARIRSAGAGLRPGMSGVGKTEAGERLLVVIWTDRLVTWLKLFMWEWLP